MSGIDFTGKVSDKIVVTRKSFLFLITGLCIYVLFLYFYVDVGAVVSAIQSANPWFYFLAFIAAVGNVLFHSLTWWNILNFLSIKMAFWKIVSYIWVGSLVDILVPLESVSGELTRAYLMNRSLNNNDSKMSNGNTGRVMASILSHRLIYTAISLVGLVAGAILFDYRFAATQPLSSLMILMIVGASFSLIFLALLSFKRRVALKFVDSILRFIDFVTRRKWNLSTLTPKVHQVLDSFYEGLRVLRHRSWRLAWPISFSVTAWLLNLFITFFVFVSLGVSVPLTAIIVVFSIIDALQTIPVGIPGEVGIIEIAMTTLYAALGVLPAVSATITILVRLVTMWFKLLVGVIMVHWVRVGT